MEDINAVRRFARIINSDDANLDILTLRLITILKMDIDSTRTEVDRLVPLLRYEERVEYAERERKRKASVKDSARSMKLLKMIKDNEEELRRLQGEQSPDDKDEYEDDDDNGKSFYTIYHN
jgi:hypothetical protein